MCACPTFDTRVKEIRKIESEDFHTRDSLKLNCISTHTKKS